MENPVVTTICRAADREGFATLRFNFRGVGASAGEFSDGKDEQEDVSSALHVLAHWPGIDGKKRALVGYSFGASVVLGRLRHYTEARSLVLIAPPISAVRDSRMQKDKRPKLFLVGEQDRIVTSVALQRALDDVHPPVQFGEIAGADHSLRGHEQDVAERVVSFVLDTLA